MLRSYINGSDNYTQIYGGQIFLDSPDRSIFNGGGGGGGGGSGIADNTRAHLDDPSLSARIYGLYWIPYPPPVHSAFNGGGGGLECVIKDAHRSAVKRPAHRSMAQGVFRTPQLICL
jgi:hypothetical protein